MNGLSPAHVNGTSALDFRAASQRCAAIIPFSQINSTSFKSHDSTGIFSEERIRNVDCHHLTKAQSVIAIAIISIPFFAALFV